jgi:ABC-type Mn2+/Zn2+ transport system ATPase subunit
VAILSAERLRLGYRNRVLAQELSFEIDRGEILGIVGPNGCGKTTLLRTMLGLLRPLDGHVARDPTVTMAYVPQRERLETLLPITALEIVLMGRTARSDAWRRTGHNDRDAARRALARVDAEALAPQLFRTLSGGQQQRVILARALAADPDVLVLDEPTAGMDIASEAAILDFLRDLNRSQGVTILVVTHTLSLVLNLATTMMLMDAGTILHGPVNDIVREDRLSALYGVPVHLNQVAGQRVLVVGRLAASDV